MLDSKIPAGSLEHKWTDYKGHCKLVNPANKRKLEVIVVGTGLAGASAAITITSSFLLLAGFNHNHFQFSFVGRVHQFAKENWK